MSQRNPFVTCMPMSYGNVGFLEDQYGLVLLTNVSWRTSMDVTYQRLRRAHGHSSRLKQGQAAGEGSTWPGRLPVENIKLFLIDPKISMWWKNCSFKKTIYVIIYYIIYIKLWLSPNWEYFWWRERVKNVTTYGCHWLRFIAFNSC